MTILTELFSLNGQVAVVTGGTGVLGGAMARGLARAGAKVGVLGRRREQADAVVAAIEADGGAALAVPADVLDLGYADYRAIDPQAWAGREAEGLLLVPHAGEMLYRGESLFRVEELND